MKVKDCMTKHVVSVGAEEPVSAAARLMSRYNLGALPVQAADGRLCGMVSLGDLASNAETSPDAADALEEISGNLSSRD